MRGLLLALLVVALLPIAVAWDIAFTVAATSDLPLPPDPGSRIPDPERDPYLEPPIFPWSPPPGFPPPVLPHDALTTAPAVDLGRQLFFSRELSVDRTVACADCHRPELAFTDGRARAVGVGGELHPRSAMSVVYAAWAPSLGWVDPGLRHLEDQLMVPLLAVGPREMGIFGHEENVLERLTAPSWRAGFLATFGEESPTLERISRAIAAFERTLAVADSAWDRWALRGEESLGESARRGLALFYSDRLGCSTCHGGVLFGGPFPHAGAPDVEPSFRRTGSAGDDLGLAAVTGRVEDRYRFRVPSLRNVAVTAPYMHDGRFATLEQVLDHYAAGPRRADSEADPILDGFALSATERADLLAFLSSLTDRRFESASLARAVGAG